VSVWTGPTESAEAEEAVGKVRAAGGLEVTVESEALLFQVEAKHVGIVGALEAFSEAETVLRRAFGPDATLRARVLGRVGE